ncbi:MAG: FtsW/RodA/SpoVE family cell cycle protein [Prevotellaceae bacterium]|jgi:cell division protein FtsW|nr:FtsW/RodA/SpoVE family cell cycle protein [Prevotellaceae bacterium]
MQLFPIRLRGDKTIWTILFIFAFISILVVHSSSYQDTMKSGSLFGALFRHVLYLVVGFAATYFTHLISISFVKRLAPVALLFVLLLLAIAFVSALVSGGDDASKSRWIMGFQPSELAKIVMVIYLAKVISEGVQTKEEFFILVLVPTGLFCILILYGHTSATVILGLNTLIMIFVGIKNRKFKLITLLAVLIAGLLYLTFDEYLGRGETAKNRVTSFFSPQEKKDPNAQEVIAEKAIASVGLIGRGPGNSKYRAKLSEANNDYIFTIIIEEYGSIGGIFVIIMYIILFYRTILIINRCNKAFPALMSCGLIMMIIIQTCVHIGVSAGALPVTGQNLPLISSGGTSLVITCVALGMILSVSRRIDEQKKDMKKKAVIETNAKETIYSTNRSASKS